MKFQINRRLLPVKAHYFFFFAALGPVLPQLNVFGKQLGVSPAVMGVVTALLPPFWAAAKPLFGYLVDFWPGITQRFRARLASDHPAHKIYRQISVRCVPAICYVEPVTSYTRVLLFDLIYTYHEHRRKLVFMILIATMTGSYCNLWFIPMPVLPHKDEVRESVHKLNQTVYVRKIDNDSLPYVEKFSCYWNCTQMATFIYNNLYLTNTTYVNALYINQAVNNTTCSFLHMEFSEVRDGETVCRPIDGCNLMCFENGVHFDGEIGTERRKRSANDTEDFYDELVLRGDKELKKLLGTVQTQELLEDTTKDFYMSPGFWVFVILMCVGTVAFNVANCIGDAVCFDVLGAEGSKYGLQRAWGTAGYGLTALLGGWLVDEVSFGQKDFTPAFIICLVATVIDLFSCRALTLPPLTSPDDGGKALKQVLRIPRVLVFITFAVVAGTLDSFIIYYMFWYLEEIAEVTGHTGQIKLIEGVVVAAQSFVGELLFFYLSGKIIKRWGYGATMTLSLFCYGVRMLLISLVKHPWHFVFIEGIMQGPTYALCYSTIVGYAAHVAPEGYSATVQGVVAGMDDGVGFALGSLVGGQLYSHLGGQISFIIFSVVAVVAAGLHAVLFALVTRDKKAPSEKIEEPQETILLEVHRKKDKRERLDRHTHIDERQNIDKYRRREERHNRGETGQRIDKRRSRERGIYRDTVEPLMQGRELKPVSVSYKR